MSDDALLQRVQALELDTARPRRLLDRHGSTSGLRHQVRNTLAMVLDVVRRSLEGLDEGEQVSVAGPIVLLRPAAAGSLALAVHELATNAIKFGALSQSKGWLAVSWAVADVVGEAPTLALNWLESGVDDVPSQPPRRGFGLEVIEEALPYQIGGKCALDFAPGGIRCTIAMPLTPTLGSLQ